MSGGGVRGGRRRRIRDPLAVHDERVLAAGFVNATALGLFGFAVLRPATEDFLSLDATAASWSVVALAVHCLAHYMLGHLRKEIDDDTV